MTPRQQQLEELLEALKAWAKDPSNYRWRRVQRVVDALAKDEG